jgi:hypothetical protein
MAKLCAHGSIVGTVEYLTTAKRYMSDGVILKNIGFGWKLAGKVKAGIDPTTAYENAKARLAQRIADKPHNSAYLKALHSITGVGKRWKIHQCISMMPDDPDGVWSEACDGYGDNVHADVDDVCDLCRLYKLAVAESRESKMAEAA